MIYELRKYRILPGKLNEFLALMKEVVLPYQQQKGVVVKGTFVGVDDPNSYVWIRGFKDQAALDKFYKEAYQSDYWLKQVRPQLTELMDVDNKQVTLLTEVE